MSTPPPPSPRAQAPGDREPRRGLTLFEKLVGVTAAILALVVGGLVLYFPAREVDALRKQLHRKAATYGNLVAAQVASAIAFHDKATAREVFESLSADPDVVGLALFTQAGEVLQQSGLMGDWTAQAGGVTQQRVLNLPERVVSITPVVSLEGPRGTLVLELSLARLQDSRRAVLRSALLAGFAALLFGTGAAWLMARSLTRRLRAIAEVASAVAGGELEREPEVDHAGDELSTVAHAFSAMLQQIRSLISNMQQMAKSENERLQGLVRAATAEVSAANDKLRAASEFLQEVYKAMPSALVVFDAEGRIQAANQASEALFERPQRELVGADLTALFEAPAASELLALARTQALLRGEKVGLSKSGQGLPVFVSATTLGQGAGGALRGVVCVVLDLREQKRLELELRQAQKLESVGRLAAGIAHEINTPVQFVSDSVHFVQTAMEDLGNILTQQHAVVQAVIEGQGSAEQAQAALDVEAELDLEYLRENVPKALARSVDGLGRIAEIVRSMKAFAHPDQKDMGLADLNKAIESTIVIARNEYKYVADAHLALEKLPLVACLLGEVNQVVLNIVVNAAHAIGDRMRATGARGNIWVATRTEGASVVISIRDDGGGIPKAIRERVFDPFFTTKEVGRGTGQGLAIARSVIVDKHKGELTFESEEGVGTTFFIKLPIEQLAAKAA